MKTLTLDPKTYLTLDTAHNRFFKVVETPEHDVALVSLDFKSLVKPAKLIEDQTPIRYGTYGLYRFEKDQRYDLMDIAYFAKRWLFYRHYGLENPVSAVIFNRGGVLVAEIGWLYPYYRSLTTTSRRCNDDDETIST